MSSSVPTPPLAITGTAVDDSMSSSVATSGPSSVPSTWICVTTSALTPEVSNRCARSTRSPPPASVHPVHRDVAPTRVEADRDVTGMDRAQLVDELGALHRGGADDHARDAGAEQGSRGLDRAHAAAGLHLATHCGTDRFDGADVGGHARTRGVEVDHVDPLRARGFEVARHRDGIVAVDGLGVVVAAEEADDLAVTDVDRGIQLEAVAHSVPLVDGTPVPSIFTASRNARATPLNDASITWWPLRPLSERMCSVIPAPPANARQNSSHSCGSKVPIHSETGSTS